MKPYDKLTILRNRHRARELRIFRDMVEVYFEQFEYDAEDLPIDWQSAKAARSRINRMLPRVLQVVEAADVGASTAHAALSGPTDRAVDILQNIFTADYPDGDCQEILDIIDMTLGVYDASRHAALARTFNPFHYVMTLLGFTASIPGRMVRAFGFGGGRRRTVRGKPADGSRLEAAVTRLESVERVIERRFAELRDWQAKQMAENTNQVLELAERLDFAERVLAQQRTARQIAAPEDDRVVTPV